MQATINDHLLFRTKTEKDCNLKVKLIFVRVDHRVIIWELFRWCCSCRFFKEEFQQTDEQDFRVINLLQRHELNNEFGDPSSPFYRRVSESGHADYILPSPCTASSQALSFNAFSVMYPSRTAGRHPQNPAWTTWLETHRLREILRPRN